MAEQTKRQELELHLAGRALRDPDFRQRLLQRPKLTIEEEIGLHFPTSLAITVHEEKLHELHIVLPIEIETSENPSANPANEASPNPLPFWKRVYGRISL